LRKGSLLVFALFIERKGGGMKQFFTLPSLQGEVRGEFFDKKKIVKREENTGTSLLILEPYRQQKKEEENIRGGKQKKSRFTEGALSVAGSKRPEGRR